MARILIIDDNYDMLSMLQMILERQGQHEVIAQSNGQDGLEAAFAERPDLALVDVMMPGMSGYEVVRQLRADPRTEDMGIIVLTARGQAVDREAALEAGADDHMSKPADVEELLEHIDDLLSRSPARAQPQQTILLPVLSLKGGVGSTTIAVNLAAVLQQVAPTVLWDLSAGCGQCAFFMRTRPEKHWGHYLENPEISIESLIYKHPSGIQLLLAPTIATQYGRLSETNVTTISQQLMKAGRFVIVDMPSQINPVAKTVLSQAYRIILISGDAPTAVQVTRATLQALQEWKNRLLVIRNSASPGPRPPLDAIQKALQIQLAVDIPYDTAQTTVEHKGFPLASVQPKAPMVIGIKRIAQLLIAH